MEKQTGKPTPGKGGQQNDQLEALLQLAQEQSRPPVSVTPLPTRITPPTRPKPQESRRHYLNDPKVIALGVLAATTCCCVSTATVTALTDAVTHLK